VNGKNLTVVNTPHTSSSSSDLIHKQLTTWTDMWSTEFHTTKHRMPCATTARSCLQEKDEGGNENENGNVPPAPFEYSLALS